MKSNTCFKKNGEPLSVYLSKIEAERSAAHEKIRNRELELVPYLCHKCGEYHLSPKDKQTPCKLCSDCIDSNGNPKELYETLEAARRRAIIIRNTRGIKLSIYHCHYQQGYHLTKR